jgi:hypothetical protein
MRNLPAIFIIGIVLGLACGVEAVPTHFVVPLSGAQEAPGPGDPDGTGTAFLTIDSDTLTIDWNIAVSNIDFPLTGAHIHVAPVGEPGPIVVDFNNQLTGGGLFDPDLAAVLANPTNYYVNVHNQPFPAGAVRGQLSCPVIPAPSALILAAFGLVSLGLRRHRSV